MSGILIFFSNLAPLYRLPLARGELDGTGPQHTPARFRPHPTLSVSPKKSFESEKRVSREVNSRFYQPKKLTPCKRNACHTLKVSEPVARFTLSPATRRQIIPPASPPRKKVVSPLSVPKFLWGPPGLAAWSDVSRPFPKVTHAPLAGRSVASRARPFPSRCCGRKFPTGAQRQPAFGGKTTPRRANATKGVFQPVCWGRDRNPWPRLRSLRFTPSPHPRVADILPPKVFPIERAPHRVQTRASH